MVKVDLADLKLALEFVSSGAELDSSAYVSLDTGAVFCVSDEFGEGEYPDDVRTSDRYVAVPDKSTLELGGRLAIGFTSWKLPEHLRKVKDIFRHKGAYSRFNGLLRSKGLLDDWHVHVGQRTEAALREWCGDNGIDLVKVRTDAADETS